MLLCDWAEKTKVFWHQSETRTTPNVGNWSVKTLGAFHSTKISGNSGSKSNGAEIFRKFVSKISVHLSRLSFFLEIPESPVPFRISTQYELAPVPL